MNRFGKFLVDRAVGDCVSFASKCGCPKLQYYLSVWREDEDAHCYYPAGGLIFPPTSHSLEMLLLFKNEVGR